MASVSVKCHDLYWRSSFLTKLKKKKAVVDQWPSFFDQDFVQKMEKEIQDLVVSVRVGLRLQWGTDVAVLCPDGTYAAGVIEDVRAIHGSNCIYTANDDRFNKMKVRVWMCRVEGCIDLVACHQFQLRPSIGGIVDVVKLSSGLLSAAQEEIIAKCRLARRGCVVLTVDGVAHDVVANDLQLLVFIDSDCCVFSYFTVRHVGDNPTGMGNLLLQTFARRMVWIAPSQDVFRKGDSPMNDELVQIAQSPTSVQSDERRAQLEKQTADRFEKCGTVLKEALAKCDVILGAHQLETNTTVGDETLLLTAVTQGQSVGGVLESLVNLLGEIRLERKHMVDEFVETNNSLTKILEEIRSISDTAQKRQQQLWSQRSQFHAEVRLTAESLKEDFVNIGQTIEEHNVTGSEDTVFRSMEAICGLKEIVDLKNCSNMSSEDVVAEVRAVLQQFEMWEELPSERIVDVGLSVPILHVPLDVTPKISVADQSSPMDMEQDGRDGGLSGDVVEGATVGQHLDDRPSSCKHLLAVRLDANVVHGASAVTQQSVPVSSESTGVMLSNSNSAAQLFSEIPTEVQIESQPSMLIRRWGTSDAVEFRFLRYDFNVHGDVLSAASRLAGVALSNLAMEYQWLRQIRQYCNYVIKFSLPDCRSAAVILLPAPDSLPENTVGMLIKKQPAPLRFALESYVNQYNPPDSDTVMRAILSYIQLQRNLFQKGRSALMKKVSDPSLLAHLL